VSGKGGRKTKLVGNYTSYCKPSPFEGLPTNSIETIPMQHATLLMVGVDAVDSRAIPTVARERTHVVLAVAAGANILEPIFVIVVVVMREVLNARLVTDTLVMKTSCLAMASLQTGDGSADRAVQDCAETG
jgi:hypothetical protein